MFATLYFGGRAVKPQESIVMNFMNAMQYVKLYYFHIHFL